MVGARLDQDCDFWQLFETLPLTAFMVYGLGLNFSKPSQERLFSVMRPLPCNCAARGRD